jgi:subtilisin family serine protease
LNSSNSGSYAAWADAIYYAVDNGANVINMSMGGSSNSTALQNAINYALNNNVCVVACMMNYNSSTTYYPAGYNGVIAVGSTNPNDERTEPFFWSSTSGSNFGNHISVVAPGNYIYGINYNDDTYYGSYWGGTSQAAPHVAGLASLLLAQNPTLSPSQIKNIIETSAEDQVGLSSEDIAGWDQYYGHGRINAFRALSQFSSSINTENNQISIVPNPFTNSCRINFDNFENDISVLVVNSIGQTLISMHNLSGHNINLDRNSLEAGIYFISVTKSGKLINTKAIEIRD